MPCPCFFLSCPYWLHELAVGQHLDDAVVSLLVKRPDGRYVGEDRVRLPIGKAGAVPVHVVEAYDKYSPHEHGAAILVNGGDHVRGIEAALVVTDDGDVGPAYTTLAVVDQVAAEEPVVFVKGWLEGDLFGLAFLRVDEYSKYFFHVAIFPP